MKIRQKVYDRMEEEYKNFIDNLKQKTPKEIIDCAYEKTIKEELIGAFYPELKKYDIEQMKALGKCKYPLDELYQGWMDCDAGIFEILYANISNTLDDIIKYQKEQANKNKIIEDR